MNAALMLGRGPSFPPRVGPDGRIAWSEGEDNVRECIRLILSTNPGERMRLPDFGGGLATLLFEPNTASTRHAIEERIRFALAAWEPRISVEDVLVEPDADDPEAAVATITYRLIANQARERVSLGVRFTH
ncbi:MAG: GPW/gp25 family protein [Verrucomicrobiales bacterium]|nr:GPW/gp25 family protein [Verrucomicrobiales bacterium]